MSSAPADITTTFPITMMIKRNVHPNGMDLIQYADAVMAGTQPILSHDEYLQYFAASDDHLIQVNNWATTNGLTVIESHNGKAVVQVSGNVGQYNNLFNAQLVNVIQDNITYIQNAGPITIPQELNGIVEFVLGFDHSLVGMLRHNSSIARPLNRSNTMSADPNTPAPQAPPLVPTDIAKAYGFPETDSTGVTIGIVQLNVPGNIGNYRTSDVNATFIKDGVLPPTIKNYGVSSSNSGDCNAETIRDIYCAGAAGYGATLVNYWLSAYDTNPLFNAFNAIANDTTNNPDIVTCGWQYYYDHSDFNPSWNEGVPLAACVVQGILVLVASDDRGGFNWEVGYPQSSRYTVAVGGTQAYPEVYDGAPHLLENGYASSGGGWSSQNPEPTWQKGHNIILYEARVDGLTASTVTLDNVGSRGVPDLAGPASSGTHRIPGQTFNGYAFYMTDPSLGFGEYEIQGTACASALYAGLFARIIKLLGQRIQLSQLMTYLYNHPEIFYDLSNSSDTSTVDIQGYDYFAGPLGPQPVNGWACSPGWDAVTGMGSISNGSALVTGLGGSLPIATGYDWPTFTNGIRPTI